MSLPGKFPLRYVGAGSGKMAPRVPSRGDTIIPMFPIHGVEMAERSHYGMFEPFAF